MHIICIRSQICNRFLSVTLIDLLLGLIDSYEGTISLLSSKFIYEIISTK